MTNCKEFVLDDLMAITAIPLANISAESTSSPVNRLTPTIDDTDITGISDVFTNAITIGLQPASEDVALIPIRRFTGKAKDEESDSVAGRLHTVTVTCDVDDRDSAVWTYLFTLDRNCYHLLLTFRDGTTQAFVSATQDTYVCNVERDGSKTTVTFRIQCLMGPQLLVASAAS